MNTAQFLVKCLETEGVKYIFGIPGEENLQLMDALADSPIKFITCRHEQGAAFMADVYGRLTGKPGVCLATLGPGATNLITGVADANMDRAPLVAIAGQASTHRMHKESHQVLDLMNLFAPITKYQVQIREPEVTAEAVRKAFKLAKSQKPGATYIELPENIAEMDFPDYLIQPIEPNADVLNHALQEVLDQAANIISQAEHPLILAGNGVIRAKASAALENFAESLNIPVVNTFMAKGVIPFRHPMAVATAGLQAGDYENAGFNYADVIICVGFDMVEYQPVIWNPSGDKKIIHIDTEAAEVDHYYLPQTELVGCLSDNLRHLAQTLLQKDRHFHPDLGRFKDLRNKLIGFMALESNSCDFPIKPQKLIWDLRTVAPSRTRVIVDVGANKMWMARLFRAELPNTCIISNGFASMGIAVPGVIAAKFAFPQDPAVAVTGDAGFLMNLQEIETAVRHQLDLVILIWNDASYGLIKWKQQRQFGRDYGIDFNNPDFVKLAESFGARGIRVERTEDFATLLKEAMASKGVTIMDCPVDYRENNNLIRTLGDVVYGQ